MRRNGQYRQRPTLGDANLRRAAQLHLHRHLRYDGCRDMASCDATFTVAAADDLTVDCPDDPMLPALQQRRRHPRRLQYLGAGLAIMGGAM